MLTFERLAVNLSECLKLCYIVRTDTQPIEKRTCAVSLTDVERLHGTYQKISSLCD